MLLETALSSPLPLLCTAHIGDKLMSIESVMLSNHLILCLPLLLLPSTFPSIRVFSNGFISARQLLDHCLLSWAISAYSAS